MKKSGFTLIIIGLLLTVSMFTFANTPGSIKEVFQKMYPNAANVEWSKKHGYQIATFVQEGIGINEWFTNKAKWVMTSNDVNSLEAVPTPVAEAFMESTMAALRLRYVRIVELPNNEPLVYIIDVQEWNSPVEFQVFYSPKGKLLQTLNVTDTGGMIYPGLFN